MKKILLGLLFLSSVLSAKTTHSIESNLTLDDIIALLYNNEYFNEGENNLKIVSDFLISKGYKRNAEESNKDRDVYSATMSGVRRSLLRSKDGGLLIYFTESEREYEKIKLHIKTYKDKACHGTFKHIQDKDPAKKTLTYSNGCERVGFGGLQKEIEIQPGYLIIFDIIP